MAIVHGQDTQSAAVMRDLPQPDRQKPVPDEESLNNGLYVAHGQSAQRGEVFFSTHLIGEFPKLRIVFHEANELTG